MTGNLNQRYERLQFEIGYYFMSPFLRGSFRLRLTMSPPPTNRLSKQKLTRAIPAYPRLLLAYFLLTLLHFRVKKSLELPREYPTMDRFLSIRICCSDLVSL